MARRPMNLVAAGGYTTPRDAIWAAIRKLRRFTLPQLRCECDRDRSTIRAYVVSLCAAGHLKIVEKGQARNRFVHTVKNYLAGDIYELVKDCGVEAPRVNKKGEKVLQGKKRERIWKSIRILKNGFTIADLVMTSSTPGKQVSKVDAQQYCQKLARAKYLKKMSPNIPARYRLQRGKNTGPKPPMVQKNGAIFDPNLNQVVYTPEGGVL